ncbi:MAG TPA: ArsC/Spx/MgsR family protein [Bacteroidales bacterium]|nr:ArsC/Spx/MgsR family protein [Bacteroidales bacterium]
MVRIYHNPRCRKSREGLEALKKHLTDIEVVDYFKNPLTANDLLRISAKLELPLALMVRPQEAYYKQNLKGKTLSTEEWIEAIITHPQLLQRPIVETADKATIAIPPENILSIL